MKKTKMVYVASPYWHESEHVRNERRQKTISYAEFLFKRGIMNYCPLAYSERYAHIQKEGYWINHGLKMVQIADEIHVLCLDGWEKSEGIKGELKHAGKDVKIRYIQDHKRLAFCGSRSLKCQKTKQLIIDEIENHQAKTIVTHGEPDGVCRLAIQVAKNAGFSLKLHHIQIYRQTGMFHHRSLAVFNDCDYCIFLHDGISSGCRNELELAIKMGIPHTYYLFEDGEYHEKNMILTKDEEIEEADPDTDIWDGSDFTAWENPL